MEKLAENQFTITKKLYIEGMLRLSRESYGKAAGRAMLVILGLWLAFCGYTLAVGGDLLPCLGLLVTISAAGLWLCLGMPRSNAGAMWRKMEAKYGSDLQRTTSFYRDHLIIEGVGLEKYISYEEITQIRQSRRLLILVCEDKSGVLLAREGFTGGTCNEVIQLLRSYKDKE